MSLTNVNHKKTLTFPSGLGQSTLGLGKKNLEGHGNTDVCFSAADHPDPTAV